MIDSPAFCPACGNRGHCINTRNREGFRYRRYECQVSCGNRWTTYEAHAGSDIAELMKLEPEQVKALLTLLRKP